MTYKIGKLKELRTTIVSDGDLAYSELVSTTNLDTNIYDDITSIENWYKYGSVICTDFLQMRLRIKELLDIKTWANCTNEEKDIVIKVYTRETNKSISVANMEKVMFLMGRGMTQSEAIYYLQESFADFHTSEIQACLKRAQSKKLFMVIAKYLSVSDGADFTRVITVPYHLFTTQGITGVNDSEAGEGIFDFIESTPGTSYETTGLLQQGYVMANGDLDATNFIIEIMDILKNGNY